MSRALVTGSSGFIGSHFARYLRKEGWDVTGIDIRGSEHTTALMDARDYLRGYGGAMPSYDLVLHCAAVVGGRAVIERLPLAQAVNLELDAALFAWARTACPGRVVYFSSSAAYPARLQQPGLRQKLAEADLELPGGPEMHYPQIGAPDALYGWAKLTGEYLARLARGDGVAVTVVRPFSGYGADQSPDYPFPAFCDRALRREDPFTIWGSGDQVRDWVHVDDIVATVMEMYRLEHNGPLNIGWGAPVSMRQLAGKICEIAGYSPEFEFAASAPAGVPWRVCSPARSWQVRRPQVHLEQGIAEALEYRKRFLR